MSITAITYTTHSEGEFENLVNNKHGVKIEVLGWGKPWNGYMDKVNGFYEHIKNLPDEHIVVIIDGFDSVIQAPLDEIEKAFKQFDTKILLSLHPDTYNLNEKIFGKCIDDLTANAGLYMGYVKYLKLVLEKMISTNYSEDDQRNLNYACKDFDFIKIDTDKIIFNNMDYYDRLFYSPSLILSKPGTLSFNRIKRSFREYGPYIWKETLVILLIIYFILLYLFNR